MTPTQPDRAPVDPSEGARAETLNDEGPTRPPWDDPPEGLHWEAVEEGADWRLVTASHRACRRACGALAVAELNRGRYSTLRHMHGESWWAYCADHMYGRWIEDGRIMSWRMVEDAT